MIVYILLFLFSSVSYNYAALSTLLENVEYENRISDWSDHMLDYTKKKY